MVGNCSSCGAAIPKAKPNKDGEWCPPCWEKVKATSPWWTEGVEQSGMYEARKKWESEREKDASGRKR